MFHLFCVSSFSVDHKIKSITPRYPTYSTVFPCETPLCYYNFKHFAQIVDQSKDRLPLYIDFNDASKTADEVEVGVPVEVPALRENRVVVWSHIRDENNHEGWIQREHLLEIYPSLIPGSPAEILQAGVGDNSLPELVKDALFLRKEPNSSSAQVAAISPGTHVTVLRGRKSADFQWWMIETSERQSGWIRERISESEGSLVIYRLVSGLPWAPAIINTTPISAVTTSRPANLNAFNRYRSVWANLKYLDLTTPGTQTYETTVDATIPLSFSFNWCADTPVRLRKILAPLKLSLFLNGKEIDQTSLLIIDQQACRKWATIINGFQSGDTHILEVYYTLSEVIFDGTTSFEAGDYVQRIIVNVQ
jgi:SH3-like domain-containing protein